MRLAADRLGVTEAEIAIACASHQGEDEHVTTVRGLLAKAGVAESALGCGPQLPSDEPTARRLLASGGTPLPIHNNCSGKHAAMLATCAVMGWPLDGYMDPAHPCQRAVAAAMSDALGIDLAAQPSGIDGCGLTTYGLPLEVIARGFAAASDDPAFRRCQDAMAAYPHLVAGTGRFDTALMREVADPADREDRRGRGVGRGRAAGRAGRSPSSSKPGAVDAIPVVAIAVLQRLGMLVADLPNAAPTVCAPAAAQLGGHDCRGDSAEFAATLPAHVDTVLGAFLTVQPGQVYGSGRNS